MEPTLIASLIPSLMQGAKAIFDSEKVSDLSSVRRPTRYVAPAIQEAVDRARIMATQTKVPGADALENNILSAGGAGIRDIKEFATSPSSALSAVSNLYGNLSGELQKLNIRNEGYNTEQIQNLIQTLPMLGAEQNKNWQYNEADPYDAAKKAEAAFRYSRDQNAFNSVSNIFGTLATLPQ